MPLWVGILIVLVGWYVAFTVFPLWYVLFCLGIGVGAAIGQLKHSY